jgi:signal-transduction protein with cAMP-binding, CBS, and nucleotidyltransferase domain
MYFINRGVVVVCSEDGKTIYNILSDGSFFGEYALLFSQKRTASGSQNFLIRKFCQDVSQKILIEHIDKNFTNNFLPKQFID